MNNAPRRRFMLAALVSAVLVIAPLQATIATAEDAPPAELEVMGEYNPTDYVDDAAELPVELVEAIDRDLGLTAEEYLAESDAAIQASDVVNALEDSGVAVNGSSIDGADLTVYVDSDAAAAVVESVGAEAIVGEPVVEPLPEAELSFAEDIYGGQGIYWETPAGAGQYYANQCSIGFNGYLVSTGAPQLTTAGHCTEAMAGIVGSVRALNFTKPGQPTAFSQLGANIGVQVANSTRFGEDYDVGRVGVTGSGVAPKPSVLRWGGGEGAPLSTPPLAITRSVDPTVGASLCRSGSRTGWRCGTIGELSVQNIGGETVNSIIATVCVLPGDSGGAAMIGSAAVGITSWRAGNEPDTVDPSCATTPFAGFFPMQGGGATVATAYGSAWELAVSVSAPTVNSNSTTIWGALANASPGSKVNVYFDGSSTPVTVSAAAGTWGVSLASLSNGLHSYRVEGQWGTWSKSPSVTGWINKNVTVSRISGADRFATSALVAEKFALASTVYVASGLDYPDALGAAPAASHNDAPLLLVGKTFMTDDVADEIIRLNPSRIVLVGSAGVVSESVAAQLEELLPGEQVDRIAGADRYDTSRQVSADAFDSANDAFVATGNNFSDALAASAAAGKLAAPVVLVYGPGTSVEPATISTLQTLGVDRVLIAGGTAVVSPSIENQLKTRFTPVTRLAGADRFLTSVAINEGVFSSAGSVYIATGLGYADALAGAALAGRDQAPLFVVPTNCVPARVLETLRALGTTNVTLLGGESVLGAGVFGLKTC